MQARDTWQAWQYWVQWFTWSRFEDVLIYLTRTYKNRSQQFINNKIGFHVYCVWFFCLKILTDIGLAPLIQFREGWWTLYLLCLQSCMHRFASSLPCDCISLLLHTWSILAVWSFARRWWRKALFSASCILKSWCFKIRGCSIGKLDQGNLCLGTWKQKMESILTFHIPQHSGVTRCDNWYHVEWYNSPHYIIICW